MSRNTGDAATTAFEQQQETDQAKETRQAVPDAAEITGPTGPHADDTEKMAAEPKPDVSDQGWKELLPRLSNYFHNNREELARALGVHRSTVDRWMNGTSRPNNSTLLRMRRLAQERRIE